jgi:hypothetical protein
MQQKLLMFEFWKRYKILRRILAGMKKLKQKATKVHASEKGNDIAAFFYAASYDPSLNPQGKQNIK